MEQMTNDTPYWKERLSAQPDVPGTNVGDIISRREAIEALYAWEMCYDWDEHCREEDPKPAYIVSPSDVIEKLPSAQPEIIHCESCEHWKNEHLCECLSRHGTFETPKNFYCGYGKAK